MYLDDTITIGTVPPNLQEIMNEVDGYYKAGDDISCVGRRFHVTYDGDNDQKYAYDDSCNNWYHMYFLL